jgi:hypothetical protein
MLLLIMPENEKEKAEDTESSEKGSENGWLTENLGPLCLCGAKLSDILISAAHKIGKLRQGYVVFEAGDALTLAKMFEPFGGSWITWDIQVNILFTTVCDHALSSLRLEPSPLCSVRIGVCRVGITDLAGVPESYKDGLFVDEENDSIAFWMSSIEPKY